jgi:hypothetical protein
VPDYILDPDPADEPARPALRRPPRVGAPAALPAYRPCQTCGVPTLTGMTRGSTVITVEPGTRCYVVLWREKATSPLFDESRAYPEHHCHPIPAKEPTA